MAVVQGVLDLSLVTERLTDLLDDCINTSPLWGGGAPPFEIRVSNDPPDIIREKGDCQVSLYLFHVSQDKFQRNSPVMGPRVPPIPFQPLSLELYYLLTVSCTDSYTREQQVMGLALKCFHDNPILHADPDVHEDFTLTMEAETADDLGRLWQAVTLPLRLSAVYKASVVFM